MSKTKKMRKLVKAAKMGNVCAMYRLGIRYQLGKGVPLDLNGAAEWISASADGGYAPAKAWIEDYGFDDNAALQAEV